MYELRRQELTQRLLQQLCLYRLGQKAVKPFVQILLPHTRNRIGGQYDHRRVVIAASIVGAQLAERLDTVLVRHQVIHQNEIIALFCTHFQTADAVLRGIDLYLCLLEQRFDNLTVHRIVVYDEHMGIRRGKTLLVFLFLRMTLLVQIIQIAHRLLTDDLLFQFKTEP